MNLPVVKGPDQSTLNVTTPGRDIRVNLADASVGGLAPGTVLNVTVERENGNSGVIIQGKFVAAKLPDQLQDGQRLQVQVQSAPDAVVLKVLSAAPEFPEQFLSQTIGQLLEQLLPNIDTKELRAVLDTFKEELPANLTRELFGEEAAAGSEDTEAPADPKLVRIFAKLIQQKGLLSNRQLENPDGLVKFLSKPDFASMLKSLGEATEAIDKLAQQAPPPAQLKILETLQSTINAMLEGKDPLNFESKATPNVLAQQLRLYLAASHSAMDNGNALSLEHISKDLESLKRLDNPLGLLSRVLSHLDFGDSKSPFSKNLVELVRGLAFELAQAKEAKGGDKELRELLTRVLDKAKQMLDGSHTPVVGTPNLAQTTDALKSLTQAVKGQELLNKINPVMQTLGEPMFILFPALTGGLLSTWEMSVQTPKVEDQEERKGKKGNAPRLFEKIALSLHFPELGAVQAEIAHRPGEIFVSISTESAEAAEFVAKELPALEKTFAALGYEKAALSTNSGAAQSVAPPWFREITKRTVVA